jgi:hypothetical protein
MHTLLDLHGSIPTFIHITNGKVAGVNVLDEIVLEAGGHKSPAPFVKQRPHAG